LARRQAPDRVEVRPLAQALQLGIGHDADVAARPQTIHADDFAPAIGDAHQAEPCISRLGGQLRGKTCSERIPPLRFGRAIEGIAATGEAGAHEALYRATLRAHIGTRRDDGSLELGRKDASVHLHALERARQRDRFDVAVGEHSDGGRGHQHQRDHGQDQASG